MPNLQGASPVGRDGEGHSYAARTVSRSDVMVAVASLGTKEGRADARAGHRRVSRPQTDAPGRTGMQARRMIARGGSKAGARGADAWSVDAPGSGARQTR